MNTTPDDDTRDAHLLAALRHAPDAEAGPSAALTRAILDQARRASPPAPWRAWRARLWEPAPMAAFATLAMATLIGVLWGGGRDAAQAPALRAPATAAAPAAAPPAAAQREAAPPATPPPAPPAPERQTRTADRTAERRRTAAAPPPAPPAAAAPAPAPPSAPPPLAERALAQDAARADEAKSAQPAAVPRERSELASRMLGAATATTAANDPWAGLRAALAQAGNQQVRWQRSSGEFAHQAPQHDAWQALDAATRAHWQPVPQPTPLADTLRLTMGGELQGEIGWDLAAGAVLWRDARARLWRAVVGVEAAQALRQRFDRW